MFIIIQNQVSGELTKFLLLLHNRELPSFRSHLLSDIFKSTKIINKHIEEELKHVCTCMYAYM